MDYEFKDYEEYDNYEASNENLPSAENNGNNLPTQTDNNDNTMEMVMQTTENIMNIAKDIKQMDAAMHQMDVQLDAFITSLDYKLQKFHGNAPIVREQLNRINDRMDRLVDKIMEMDPKTEQEYDYKLRMLDSLDTYSDKISTLMIKLLES